MTREIPLTKGAVALVDDADYDRVNAFKWCAHLGARAGHYACRRARPGEAGATQILMHRFIVGARQGGYVDHINGDALDNRRENLRLCTPAESALNRRGYGKLLKGVAKKGARFHARISLNGRRISLGWFPSEIEAAVAYDEAARRLHGQFAHLNFPNEHSSPPLAKQDGKEAGRCVEENFSP